MKAARFYGAKDIRVEELLDPEPGPRQVKLKIAWCGICGSDLHEYLIGPIGCPKTPHPTTGEKIPVTMGHEFSGAIVAVGVEVDQTSYTVGSNAVVEPLLHCKRADCENCTAGLPNLCDHICVLGLMGGGGGLSGYVTVDARYVHVIPDNIPLDIAACIEPLAVVWHAIKRSNFKQGDTCLIIGGGPIGLFTLKVLKTFGCSFVAVSEPAKARREKSIQFGADLALNPVSTDVVKLVKERTNGKGVDIAFECAGSEPGLATAVAATKARGTIMNISIWEKQPVINMGLLVLKEKTLTASCCYVGVHKEVIEALSSGKLSGISELITRRIPITDVVSQGFEALVHDKDNQIKILVHPEHGHSDAGL